MAKLKVLVEGYARKRKGGYNTAEAVRFGKIGMAYIGKRGNGVGVHDKIEIHCGRRRGGGAQRLKLGLHLFQRSRKQSYLNSQIKLFGCYASNSLVDVADSIWPVWGWYGLWVKFWSAGRCGWTRY